ncbi:MAG: hypothetical protein RIC35_20605 [Marinoscillum sp.]
MKNILLIALAFCLAFAVEAQSKDLKGPAYKNRKPWKDPKATSTVTFKKGESLKGPVAKNSRPLERKQGELVAIDLTTTEKPMGPAYKNRKPWSDNSIDKQNLAEKEEDDNPSTQL